MLHGNIWFQGFNDVIDPSKAAKYGPNLINLIHDIHVDLDTPRTPFIIGELGMQGVHPDPLASNRHLNFWRTQRSVAYWYMPKFRNDTIYVKTSPNVKYRIYLWAVLIIFHVSQNFEIFSKCISNGNSI